MQDASSAHKLMRVATVCRRLDVSAETVKRMLKDGRLLGTKLGQRKRSPWRIDSASVEDLLKGVKYGR